MTENDDCLYHKNLAVPVTTMVRDSPSPQCNRVEWYKIMEGLPVEIYPALGEGFKLHTVEEWTARWTRNEEFPECLACHGFNTKEHHFQQVWCRGKKYWESESICLDCHMFTWREYRDPDYKTPSQLEREYWENLSSNDNDILF